MVQFIGHRGLAQENKWYGTYTYKTKGKRNKETDLMIEYFKESGHTILRGISAFNRGILKKKGGRSTIDFTAESSYIKLLLRTIYSAHQLSRYGGVSSWCEDLAQKILRQTSLSEDKSISRENDQSSKKFNPQEVDSWVRIPTRIEGSFGNRLRDYLQQIKGLGISGIYETSLCWDAQQNHSRCG